MCCQDGLQRDENACVKCDVAASGRKDGAGGRRRKRRMMKEERDENE